MSNPELDLLIEELQDIYAEIMEYNESPVVDDYYAQELERRRLMTINKYYSLLGDNVTYIDFNKSKEE